MFPSVPIESYHKFITVDNRINVPILHPSNSYNYFSDEVLLFQKR